MQGWRKRMEDSHISDLSKGQNGKSNIFGVFDGHGGKEVAVYVKKHFTEELLANANYQKGEIKRALIETFLRMDVIMTEKAGKEELKKEALKSKKEDELLNKGNKNSQMELLKNLVGDPKENGEISMFTGCTACVCLIHDGKFYFANAGDSRVVLSASGIAYPMSFDHKPELDAELKRIEKAGGWVSDGRIKGYIILNLGNLNLSRSLGDLEYKQSKRLSPEEQMITAFPDVIVENISSECEFVILGCDGVWDCKTNQEAVDYVQARLKKNPNAKLSKIVEDLFDEILAPDIYTGIYNCKYFRNWSWL
jgi:serine/threonine protein phosphatase PrpC